MTVPKQDLGTEGKVEISLTPEGLIHVVGEGYWSEELILRSGTDLLQKVELRRRENANVRVLLDFRRASIQSAGSVEQMQSTIDRTFSPGDRVAVLVDSMLAKMQSDRVGSKVDFHKTFSSEDDAKVWLRADLR